MVFEALLNDIVVALGFRAWVKLAIKPAGHGVRASRPLSFSSETIRPECSLHSSENTVGDAHVKARMKGFVLVTCCQTGDAQRVRNIKSHSPAEAAEVQAAIPGHGCTTCCHPLCDSAFCRQLQVSALFIHLLLFLP